MVKNALAELENLPSYSNERIEEVKTLIDQEFEELKKSKSNMESYSESYESTEE